MSRTLATRSLATPALLSGTLMAVYLLTRPYGDGGDGAQLAEAIASPWWVLSHVAGAASLSAAAWLTARAGALTTGWTSRVARWAGPIGLVGVLPYYGAETFALHVLGKQALAGQDVLHLVELVRNQPVGMGLFGAGLLLLAAGGVAAAMAWQRSSHGAGRPGWAAWPLGLLIAGVLPQFYLPVPGRMAFGVAYLAAALLLARAAAAPAVQAAGHRATQPVAG